MKQLLLRGFIFIGGVTAVLGGLSLWWAGGEKSRVHEAVVKSARLAAIPSSDYKAKTEGNVFSRVYWISFRCDDAAFTAFIEASPSLRNVTPYIFPFSQEHAEPTTFDQPPEYEREAMRNAEYFWGGDIDELAETAEFWRSTTSRKKGRRYEIIVPEEAIFGWLLRDDESGEVFLLVRYS
ncbi:hypothetical protein FEM03_19080 [Phragmitibacter flavus]|uniref:Uncharacterized protein n=1 Tax=Phragmitibacter flavus TaxID=2576071 RepID=A0A5R8KA54_9BACT|nr:hypothetical protein [Phragmitibacter flavus]TLD69203.1 hypothetical protein FEM03_19080 [Phragmitibacter flavus]